MDFDIADIGKTLGAFMAFVVVVYIGVMFYKKEGSFSDDYVQLLEQYKIRNDELLQTIDDQKKECAEEILTLRLEVEELRKEISYLHSALQTHPASVV